MITLKKVTNSRFVIRYNVHFMKRKAIFLGILSGILLSLTVYPLQWKFLVWFALIPLLIAIESANFWKAFGLGCLSGSVYYAVLLYWILYYNVGIFFSSLFCVTLFFGIFSGWTYFVVRWFKGSLIRAFIPAILWMGLQYLYGLTSLGSAAMDLEPLQIRSLIQLVSISGVSPLTFVFLLSNSLIAYGVMKRDKKCIVALATLILILVFEVTMNRHLSASQASSERKISVACIQPNFPVDDGWRYSHTEEIFGTYRQMALEASRTGAQLIVFPQYTLPVDVYRQPERMSEIAKDCQAHLVLGTYTQDKESQGKYNLALVFSPKGKIIGEYRAVRPPPFRRIGQIRGRNYTVVQTSLGRLGLLLCYDDIEPYGARTLVNMGAEILITMTNNGNFRKSAQLYLHFAKDILRAVETHRFVVRCATTGISAIIDSNGNVLAKSSMGQKEIIYSVLLPQENRTFFVRYGDFFRSLGAFFSLVLLGIALRRSMAKV